MKKKYILTLSLIGFMLFIVLSISTGYGVWLATHANATKSSSTLDCFKVYFSSGDTIELKNIEPIVNEEGLESSPYTLTITNICDNTKELEVRLSILNSSTIDSDSLTIQASGNITQDTILFKNLSNAKTTDEAIKESRVVGDIEIAPNETIRTNIKLWFDEKKSPTIASEAILDLKFEILDKDKAIKPTFAEYLLADKEEIDTKATPSFANISYTNEGLYLTTSNTGNAYYYRGLVTNNYVLFADQLWRIIGINSDNTVKLILNNSSTTTSYSTEENAIDYTGLKYIYNNETINNDINTYLESWYKDNITSKNLDSYVAVTQFCNDSSYTQNGTTKLLNSYNRLINNKEPSLACPETNADFGGTYSQKIGLITADEVALAGGLYNTDNTNFYLYNGESFFTMTPSNEQYYRGYLFAVNSNGALTTTSPTAVLSIRPVISLDPTVTISGSGTIDDPYTIDLD